MPFPEKERRKMPAPARGHIFTSSRKAVREPYRGLEKANIHITGISGGRVGTPSGEVS